MVVIVSGWKTGFNKVKFNKLIRRYTHDSLSLAKQKVDSLLKGEQVKLDISSKNIKSFYLEAINSGILHVFEE